MPRYWLFSLLFVCLPKVLGSDEPPILLIPILPLPKSLVALVAPVVKMGIRVTSNQVCRAQETEVRAAAADHVVASVALERGRGAGGAGCSISFEELLVGDLIRGQWPVDGLADSVLAVPGVAAVATEGEVAGGTELEPFGARKAGG